MSKIAIGVSYLKMGATGANGVMGGSLSEIKGLAEGTVIFNIPESEKTDIMVEESDDPFATLYKAVAKSLEWATRDMSNTMLKTAFNGVVSPAIAAAPVGFAGTVSGTGGTLAADDYFLKVTALNAAGETIGSTELTKTTTGATSKIDLTCTEVTGASKYRWYIGLSTNLQDKYFETETNEYSLTTLTAAISATVPVTSTANVSRYLAATDTVVDLGELSVQFASRTKNSIKHVYNFPRVSVTASMSAVFTKTDTPTIKFISTLLTPFDANGDALPVFYKDEVPA